MGKTQQTILVTGASAGIGKAIARQLLSEGHTVYVAARRLEQMHDLERAGARALRMDITDAAQVEEAVATIEAESGGVDVLVNNAGYAVYGSVEDVTIEDARRQFEVNLFGLADLTQRVLPHMRGQRRGRIINMSSMGGKIYTPLGAWYHATKHALEGWSDCLRLEVSQFGIDVVIVEPGGVQSEFGDVMGAPMMERSRGSAYEPLAQAVATATSETYEKGKASPPELIARTVSRAIAARRPRTRYVAGYLARPLMWLRRWLSDRTFDRLVLAAAR